MKWAVIARREIAAYFRSPVSYLVGALFLLVQGYAFWFLLTALNQQSAPSNGPALYFFGGSFLFWLFLWFIAAVIAMRLIAEEKRLGTIEPLLTAPLGPAEIIIGKYLAALVFYAALWAPTSVYLLWLYRLTPAGLTLDAGPLLAGYLGTLLIGASALAICLVASTVTQHQLLAVVLGFFALTFLQLLGAASELAAPGSIFRLLGERISLQRQMEDFARGLVDTRALVLHLGLVALGLWAAIRLLALPRMSRWDKRRMAGELALLLIVIGGVNIVSNRYYRRLDWTRARQNTLAPMTRDLLSHLTEPVNVYVMMLPSANPPDNPADPFPPVRDLLEQYRAYSPMLRVEYLSTERDPDRVRLLAQRFGMTGDELDAGAVAFERQTPSGPRTQYVPRSQLADFTTDPDGMPHLQALRAEAAFDSALYDILQNHPTEVCFTRGHGELRIDSLAVDGMTDWGDALKRSHHRLRTLATMQEGIPADCQVAVLAGPERPFTSDELAALENFWQRGGRILLLLGPALSESGPSFPRTGLETFLERRGVHATPAIVLDPTIKMAANSLAWAIDDGYGDHPISRNFAGARTVWSLARPLSATPQSGWRASSLARTSESGWGETDLGAVLARPEQLRYDAARDLKGPITVALALQAADETAQPKTSAAARLVVFGAPSLARNDHDVYFNRDFLVAAVTWLAGTQRSLGIAPQIPAQFRLSLDQGQINRVFWSAIFGLPLLVLLLGAGVWWRRRS